MKPILVTFLLLTLLSSYAVADTDEKINGEMSSASKVYSWMESDPYLAVLRDEIYSRLYHNIHSFYREWRSKRRDDLRFTKSEIEKYSFERFDEIRTKDIYKQISMV